MIPEFLFYKEYIDDGETGTNFNRPQFQQMMDDLDKGLINCIICKDCSRFGNDTKQYKKSLQSSKGFTTL